MRTPRYAGLLPLLCCAALTVGLATPAGAHANGPEPARAPHQTFPVARTDLNITGFICQALEGATKKGASALVRHFTAGGFDGGLALTLVVKAGFTKCPQAVSAVGKFVKRLLGVQRKPISQQRASPENRYLRYLETYRVSQIAAALKSPGIRGPSDVYRFANALCSAARNSLNPRPILAYYVPGATRRSRPALNAVVELVIRGRCPLTSTQRSYLALGVTSYVLAKTGPQLDLVPPVVVMYAPQITGRYSDGSLAATLRWAGFDSSGIRRFVLWERFSDGWRILYDTRVAFRPGFRYLFAVRAQDNAGNYSPFSYLSYRLP